MKLLTLALLCLFTLRSSADVFSLAVQNGVKTYQVPSNVVATVTHVACNSPNYSIAVTTQGLTLTYSSVNGVITNLPSIAGPATISMNAGLSGGVAMCTMETKSAIPYPYSPNSAVVIPNDGGGPVSVSLESSTDMVNWAGCQAGTYSTGVSNRFFRVKASR